MIAEMQRDELRLAIEQPAAHHGVVFETGLVEEIIKDVQGQAGYLPLLQYTLDLLWETEKETGSLQDRTLNISTYRRLGGVRGALQKHVDRIYSNLSEQEQLAVQRIFLKLVEIGGDEESETQWKPIRRRANRSEFSDELEQKSLTRLINQNLLVSNRPDQSQESIIEIAHEILLTSWTTLSAWILENRQAIALRNRLNDDVARWQAKKAEDELWSGSKLEQVLELRKDPTFNQVLGGFSPAANQFIDASLEKRDRLLREEQERSQREIEQLERLLKEEEKAARAERVRTRFAVATAGLAIVAVVIGGIAGLTQRKLQEATRDFLLGYNLPDSELVQNLPSLFDQAKQFKAAGDVELELAAYRRILDYTSRLETERLPGQPSGNQQEIQAFSKKAARYLVEGMKPRLHELEDYLNRKEFGSLKSSYRFADFEKKFEPGALQPTYKILMREFGAKADLNDDGLITNPKEASRMPCEILVEIEKLWRRATQNRCGWFAPNFETIEESCVELKSQTLTNVIFDQPYTVPIDRLKSCGITPK
jgi:23S rRNA pseudoU1915 N3-methylase RlmH